MIKVFTVIFEVPDDYNLLTYGDVGLAIYNGLSSQMPKGSTFIIHENSLPQKDERPSD
jgi:hypothetical protein